VLALLGAGTPGPAAPPPNHAASLVEIEAQARAGGNRREEAVRLARALLAHRWPAQVLKVRVDGAGRHLVAGIVLSGVKFHAPLDDRAFLAEATSIVLRAFAASPVEEVDIWATVPISVGKGAVVAGDFAQPTTRLVFSATVRRSAAAGETRALAHGDVLFWDPAWRATLHGAKGR
jgi:hypothetical protein